MNGYKKLAIVTLTWFAILELVGNIIGGFSLETFLTVLVGYVIVIGVLAWVIGVIISVMWLLESD